jgi:hypothetical protein
LLTGFDLTQRNRFGAIYAESIRCGAVQQKVRYSTDRIMKLRDNLFLADFVIEAAKPRKPHAEGGCQGGGNCGASH